MKQELLFYIFQLEWHEILGPLNKFIPFLLSWYRNNFPIIKVPEIIIESEHIHGVFIDKLRFKWFILELIILVDIELIVSLQHVPVGI